MPSLFDLSSRVAVVLGGTSGIGRALSVGLAEHGADVVPSGRREANVHEVSRAIEAMGRRTLRQTCDVSSRESIDALRDRVLEHFGRVDILVYAAGITFRQATLDVPEQRWDDVFDTGVTGAVRSAQSFHGALKASGRGRIVNIASLSSYVAFHEVAAYSAAKSALLSLTRNLGCEWARDGILVNAIAPGVFPTELNRSIIEGTERGRELLTRTPMHRFGRPEELVGAAVLLASDAASFMTGTAIAVDGGFLASGVNS
ncbi:SDR family NAD(P)-dependent oxidoreductase [Nevskia soli]|uniref:SDR family NAD(P)-dependent oxidoreductase n=1 Tax=Nevskia soli TaxID=418856 RepID=UPI0015D698BD|nr:SDR family oxidoreductase [Nevskia soli]